MKATDTAQYTCMLDMEYGQASVGVDLKDAVEALRMYYERVATEMVTRWQGKGFSGVRDFKASSRSDGFFVKISFSFTTDMEDGLISFTEDNIKFEASTDRYGRRDGRWYSTDGEFAYYAGENLHRFVQKNHQYAVHFPHLLPELADVAVVL